MDGGEDPRIAALEGEHARLARAQRGRRRLANGSFLAAGAGLGTLAYVLRTRLDVLRASEHRDSFLLLLAVTVVVLLLGAHSEREARAIAREADELRRRIWRLRDPGHGDRRV